MYEALLTSQLNKTKTNRKEKEKEKKKTYRRQNKPVMSLI